MRKKILVKVTTLTLAAIILSACSAEEMVEVSFDAFVFESVEEMTGWATHTIRGEVLDKRLEWRVSS